jgi:hypothetical protein
VFRYDVDTKEVPMAKTVADMTTGELRDMMEDLIEEKLVQLLGDPDEGLEIRESLRDRLQAQQEAVAAGTRGESFEDLARRLGL